MRSRRRIGGLRSAPQLAIERLEERALLTGNVLAFTDPGKNLIVRGDLKSNEIAIQATETGIQVSSLDGTTTINGGPGPFSTSGPIKNVLIYMGSGDDVVQFGGSIPSIPATSLAISGNLVIDGGFGNDTIHVVNSTIGGDVCITGFCGNDEVSIGSAAASTAVSIGRSLTVNGGSGNDTLLVFNAKVTRDVCIWSGCGDDHVQVGYDAGLGIIGVDERLTGHVEILGSLKIVSDGSRAHVAVADTNVARNLTICTSCGNDEVLIGAAHTPADDPQPFHNLVYGHVSVGGCLDVRTNRGDDTLVLVDVSVDGKTNFNTGSGNDHIAVLDSDATFKGDFTIDSGSGNDAIMMVFSAALGKFSIDAGSGNDCIWLAADLFQQSVKINGGCGNDQFMQSQSLFPNTFLGGAPVLSSIETELPNVSPTDAEVQACFAWINELLGV